MSKYGQTYTWFSFISLAFTFKIQTTAKRKKDTIFSPVNMSGIPVTVAVVVLYTEVIQLNCGISKNSTYQNGMTISSNYVPQCSVRLEMARLFHDFILVS